MTTPTDPSQIQAGTYELVALSWDEPTSKPGEPYDYTHHVQGDRVNLNVEEARRLVLSGAVTAPGAAQKARAEALRASYEASLAALPQDVRDKMAADQAAVAKQAAVDAKAGVQPPPVA